jgi:hypothetical protein
MALAAIPTLTLTVTAAGAITAHRFVKFNTQCVADENSIGVARSAAATGEKVPVDVHGTVIVEAGAAVAAGATLKPDASGRAITWAASGAKIGLALSAASAAGDMIEVLLIDNVA